MAAALPTGITGTDTALAQLITKYVQAENTARGLKPAVMDALAAGLAKAIIEHLVLNTLVSTAGTAAAQQGTIK